MSTVDRARRLAAGDRRSYVERVADALADLDRAIKDEGDSMERLRGYGDALSFIRTRAKDEFVRTMGREP